MNFSKIQNKKVTKTQERKTVRLASVYFVYLHTKVSVTNGEKKEHDRYELQ